MTESGSSQSNYVLGIDLGTTYAGWAAISLNQSGKPTGVLRTGVRVFDTTVTGNVEKGQEESNAIARRNARLVRRQLRRHAARQNELFQLLQQHGLLPAYQGAESNSSRQRHQILNALDHELVIKRASAGNADAKAAVELPLYLLRKIALDAALEPFELGRVFYHLSQRRGYKSNRKEKPTDKKKVAELGVVESGIEDLTEEMHRAHARTLGEYFASLDPHAQKIRGRWTARKMYEEEFALIWEKQATFRPDLLTEELHHQVKHLLFYQRPLKAQSHLIGRCELEPGERRAAWATLEAQEFRLLQEVNNLEIILPGSVIGVPLTAQQRQTVLDLLENSAEVTFKQIRKALGLANNAGFNLQHGGETRLKGNATNAYMNEVFGERWSAMPDGDKKQVVEDWRTIEQEDSLVRRAVSHWHLDEANAQWLASRSAPNGYCAFSRKAISKMLPFLAAGKSGQEAEIKIYGSRLSGGKVYDRIPPVRDFLKNLRNPAVERSLTELRKVVNALVQEYGKPAEIRIQLARELKKSRHERMESVSTNRDRERQRNATKEKLLKELGLQHPSCADIEKALLWEECQGVCPYTGKQFPFSSLFGENPPMQVQHIIPFSRIPDDSFQNKTLCSVEENQYKANRTPFEAYADPAQYEAILDRVKNWPRPNRGKQRRFELRTLEELEGFSSRQLNCIRYASQMACKLMGTLYGGRDMETAGRSRQIIFASTGMLTGTLRRAWGLEAILREETPSSIEGKPRNDYRHHAIDAIAVALSRPKLIAALSRSDDSYAWATRALLKIESPWKNFIDSIRPHFDQMLVSHRPEHRLTGEIHKATNYSMPHEEDGKQVVHLRRPVPGLTMKDIENIVDPATREAVRAKAVECGNELVKWTPNQGGTDWPQLVNKSGKHIPIKKVRVKEVLNVRAIGKGESTRYVALKNNHHVAIFALLNEVADEKRWVPAVVSLFDAMQRKNKSEAVIQTTYSGSGKAAFKFSLMGGDTLLLHKDCDHGNSKCNPSVWQVRTIAVSGQLSLVRINDARQKADILKAKEWWSPSVETLRKLEAIKVTVDSLGGIHQAGG